MKGECMENKIIGYKIFDNLKKVQVGKDYKPEQKRRARNKADKMDAQYGAYRYYVKPIFEGIKDFEKII